MPELPGLGKSGRTVRAEVTLLNGHDGASAAAPEASTRFFTNSRRRIFKGALRERRIGASIKNRVRGRGRGLLSFYESRRRCVNAKLKIEALSGIHLIGSVLRPLFTMRHPVSIAFLFLLAVLLPVLAQQPPAVSPAHQQFLQRLVEAAIERTHVSVRYDPSYVRIPYPNGDVPPETGVCTDEIIRAYRVVGVDLQKEVHEDMLHNFSAYPNQRRWLLAHTDTNIDHRRVPNLMTFFTRKGEPLAVRAWRGLFCR
jgi:uncharacterized protein YijF (DUF1287 family)